MGFAKQICDSINETPCNWNLVGRNAIENKSLGVKIEGLGNVMIFERFRFLSSTSTSIMDLYINGIRVDTCNSESRAIEIAFWEWLRNMNI